MFYFQIKPIERRWNCLFDSIVTYRPNTTQTFGKLGKAKHDENFIRISFDRKRKKVGQYGYISALDT
jgi:hypothetical protein